MKNILTLLALSLTVSAYAQDDKHRAWIATDQQGDLLTIQGKFANDSKHADTLRYELITTKQGTSGSSRSAQSGEFAAPAEQEVSLSRSSINVTKKDTYLIELKIFRDGAIYLEDRIEY